MIRGVALRRVGFSALANRPLVLRAGSRSPAPGQWRSVRAGRASPPDSAGVSVLSPRKPPAGRYATPPPPAHCRPPLHTSCPHYPSPSPSPLSCSPSSFPLPARGGRGRGRAWVCVAATRLPSLGVCRRNAAPAAVQLLCAFRARGAATAAAAASPGNSATRSPWTLLGSCSRQSSSSASSGICRVSNRLPSLRPPPPNWTLPKT